jgi:hypothetical protein
MRALPTLAATTLLWTACSSPESIMSGDGDKSDDLGDAGGACQAFLDCVHSGERPSSCIDPASDEPLCETAAERDARHQRIAELRGHPKIVIVHRGSWDFGHENTLEAFRATMQLGAEGNEIDIRTTSDGVLILFHDDTVDRALVGVGVVADMTWQDLQELPFRQPGVHGEFTRVATLAETLLLHREIPGLIHLDIKKPGIDDEIAEFLDALDMWDHIILANDANSEQIRQDARYAPRSRMVGLSVERRDLDPALVADAVARAQDGIFVDDPRATLLALGRVLGSVSADPVLQRPWTTEVPTTGRSEGELRAAIRDADGWNELSSDDARNAELAAAIEDRARAAIELGILDSLEQDTLDALTTRVRQRSMHKNWEFHGLDGQEALFALADAGASNTVELAREMTFLDDPALTPIKFPGFPNAAVDWRMKGALWDALEQLGENADAAQLCRDYLALSDAEADALGFHNFEQAAETLLRVAPSLESGRLALRHRRSDVRARAIMEMLQRLDEGWAQQALEEEAPYALEYVVEFR